MANIELISKAKLTGAALKKILTIEPDYDISLDTVRLYYAPDKLAKVQKIFEKIMAKKTNMPIDFIPIITPYIIKNYSVYLLAALFLSYVVGKIKTR